MSGTDFSRFVSVDAVTTKAGKSVVPIRELATNSIQIGKTMSWSEMLKTYEAGAKTFNRKPGQ